MRYEKFKFRLTLEDQYGGVRQTVMFDLGENFWFKIEKPFLTNLDELAQSMKQREKRAEYIHYAMSLLGEHMIDCLNDKDGWNGDEGIPNEAWKL